jgi:peroxiredoxin
MGRLTPADPFTVALGLALLVAVGSFGLLGWFCYRLLVDRGRLLLRLPEADDQGRPFPRGLPGGSFLSDFALPRLDGSVATLIEMLERPLLLVFVRGDCLFSRALAGELAALEATADAPRPMLIVVGESDDAALAGSCARLPYAVLRDATGQVARLLRVSVTPAGYRVDLSRRTNGPLLAGPAALLAAARGETVEDVLPSPWAFTPVPPADAARAPLGPGDPAPRFTLPTPEGTPWAIQDHLGAPFGLVFADPDCPPCQPLLAEMRRRAADGIVVVSRGAAEENRRLGAALGAAVPVVVQENREVARAFRTLETPAAYLIDAAGAIAAGPAIGAEEVLALIAQAPNDTVMDETRLARTTDDGSGRQRKD